MGCAVQGGGALTQGPGPQMAYQAWVTNAQTVLRQQRQERQGQTGQLPTGASGHVRGGGGARIHLETRHETP